MGGRKRASPGFSGGVRRLHPSPYASIPLCRRAVTAIFLITLAIPFFLIPTGPSGAEEPEKHPIAVFVSQDIRPYIAALEGLAGVLDADPNVFLDTFHLEKLSADEQKALVDRLSRKEYRVYVAIGPLAVRFLWDDLRPETGGRLYSMVLNPEKMVPPGDGACGVSLNLPVAEQLRAIRSVLPGVEKIGLLYDPKNNGDFYDEAKAWDDPGLSVVPVPVSSRKDIPAVLKDHWGKIDALWLIPDRTVTTESLIRYILREAIYNRVPGIGYNRFFYESGAVLSFVFDYREIGGQCGEEVLRVLAGGPCDRRSPLYRLWLNEKVAKSMAVSLSPLSDIPVEVGP